MWKECLDDISDDQGVDFLLHQITIHCLRLCGIGVALPAEPREDNSAPTKYAKVGTNM